MFGRGYNKIILSTLCVALMDLTGSQGPSAVVLCQHVKDLAFKELLSLELPKDFSFSNANCTFGHIFSSLNFYTSVEWGLVCEQFGVLW